MPSLTFLSANAEQEDARSLRLQVMMNNLLYVAACSIPITRAAKYSACERACQSFPCHVMLHEGNICAHCRMEMWKLRRSRRVS